MAKENKKKFKTNKDKADGLVKKILSRKKYVAIGIVVAVVAAWIGFNQFKPDFELETYEVKKDTLVESVTAAGDVQSDSAVDLHFQSSARLAWVGIKEGQSVSKYQAIASLDKRDLEKNLKKYLNLYVKERQDFDQTQEDYDDWPELSDDARDDALRILEKAQMDLNNTVLDVEIRNLAVELATITTPIAGIVTEATPSVAGVNVTPATATYSIVDPDTVYFEAEVSEFEVPRISTDQKVVLRLDAYPDEEFEGYVETISFQSTTTSTGGTAFIAKIPLPLNSENRFRIGMNGEAEFVVSEKADVLMVPLTSLIEEDEKEYVWIVENGRAKRVEIKTGASSLNNIEVTEGLEEDNVVILRPPSDITEGAKIKSS